MRCLWVAGLVAVACGDSSEPPRDSSEPPIPPGEAALVATLEDGSPAEITILPRTALGARTMARLSITNKGTATSGPISVSLLGDRDFELDVDGSTCAGEALESTQSCAVTLTFWPTVAGVREAQLRISALPGGALGIPVSGEAIVADLQLDPPELAVEQVETGTLVEHTFVLRNATIVDVPIEDLQVTGHATYALVGTTCDKVLAAGASCSITVGVSPQELGLLEGALAVSSGDVEFSARLRVRGARRITIEPIGSGVGEVTSSPVGIACGTTCTALFEDAVTLEAAMSATNRFLGWSVQGCGASPTCMVSAGPEPVTVQPVFEAIQFAPVAIELTGNASGDVRLRDAQTFETIAICDASCTVSMETTDSVEISASTPSRYAGMSGDCVTDQSSCVLEVGLEGVAVSIHFEQEAGEQWTRILPEPPFTAAIDSSGNVIVGSRFWLTKLAPNGAIAWMLPENVHNVATGPGDTIYVDTATQIRKLRPDGSELWARPHDAQRCEGDSHSADLAVAADGSVVRVGGVITRWDTNGTLSWTRQASGCGIAIDDQTATVYNLRLSNSTTDVRQIAPDGTELQPLIDVIPGRYGRIRAAHGGGFVICTADDNLAMQLRSPAGNATEPRGNFVIGQFGCAGAGSDAGWVYEVLGTPPVPDPNVWRFHRIGSELSLFTRPVFPGPFGELYGTAPRTIVGAPNGRIIVGGTYSSPTEVRGWVQAFDP